MRINYNKRRGECVMSGSIGFAFPEHFLSFYDEGMAGKTASQAKLSSCGSSMSDSAASEEGEEKENDTDPDKDTGRRPKLELVLREKSGGLSVSSLDSSTSESLLEELLCDIRRSRPASLASTPTFLSCSERGSDCETDCVRDCGRSEAELKGMGIGQLRMVLENLEHETDTESRLLVRLLHVRDKRAGRLVAQYSKLTLVLRHFAKKSGFPGYKDIQFTLHRPESQDRHSQWLAAWTVLSQLPKGIPKHWRKTLWSSLAEYGTLGVDWTVQLQSLFSEFSTPEDEKLGTQIVKDLHRTGTTGFSSDAEHAVLKRVLLAYARFNKKTGYCQGFNILAAFILKVVEFDETMALMVLVYLVDHRLPENYFCHTLYALSGDMAVFRHLLKFYLPELALHMETLQKEASGTIRKSYSSDNPPSRQSVHAYEPPLADVFSMQWFLTIFASVLPRKACRRVWDAIFLEGSEYVLYTAVAILAVMERDLLLTSTAADFYMAMSKLSNQLRKAHIMSSIEFMQVVYAIKRTTSRDSEEPVPVLSELREKYTYNIYPCGLQPAANEVGGGRREPRPLAPLPSRGGSFAAESSCDESRMKQERRRNGFHSCRKVGRETPPKTSLQKTLCVGGERDEDGKTLANMSGPQQIRYLGKHYSSVAQQPSHIHCDLHLAPPIARAYCPQQEKDKSPVPYYTAYAADVPLSVIQQSRVLSGFDQMVKLHEQRKEQFMISFTGPYQHPGRLGRAGRAGEGEVELTQP